MMRTKGKVKIDDALAKNNVLWRYLDTAKFLDFLSNGTLYFNRADQFQDKFEGAFTQSIRHAIETSFEKNKLEGNYDDFKRKLREHVFINCWHKSPNDSMAMWQLYGQSNCSVAITTTIGKLESALNLINEKQYISINKVSYVKHWRDPSINVKPYSNVFSYKVVAYEYEKEVRVILDKFDDEVDDCGIAIYVGLDTFLRSVVIHPEAPQWFTDLIRDVVKKYGVTSPVNRSLLSKEPI